MNWRSLALVLVAGLVVAAVAGGIWLQRGLAPVDPDTEETEVVTIRQGAGSAEVAAELHDLGVISNAWVFRLWTRYEGLDGRLQAGEYRVSPSESVPELVDRFIRGDVIRYRVTIPEGFRVEQIVERVGDLELVDKDRLREIARDPSFVAEWLPDDDRIQEPLEGYLFPDTYSLTRDMDEADIIRTMVRRTRDIFTQEWLARAEEMGLTVHEVLTLASIVEREARVAHERVYIAGVFWNRHQIGMKLDADPTVQYAVGKFVEPLTNQDLQSDSPYNTYVHGGLPPGPIAAPGRAAVEAVLFPKEHDYLYFVLMDEATGEHAFASTLEEHNANVRRYR